MPPMPPNVDATDDVVIAEDGNPKSNTSTGKTEEEVEVSPTDNSKQEQPNDDVEVGGDVGASMIKPGEDGSQKRISSYRDMEDTRTKSFVIIVACAAALGGLIFGYDIGGAGKNSNMPYVGNQTSPSSCSLDVVTLPCNYFTSLSIVSFRLLLTQISDASFSFSLSRTCPSPKTRRDIPHGRLQDPLRLGVCRR